MQKYTIQFEPKQDKNSNYISLKINEPIQTAEAIGDTIGFYRECNCLEFDCFIDVEDIDIRDFIKTYFKDYRAVLGIIRKLTE